MLFFQNTIWQRKESVPSYTNHCYLSSFFWRFDEGNQLFWKKVSTLVLPRESTFVTPCSMVSGFLVFPYAPSHNCSTPQSLKSLHSCRYLLGAQIEGETLFSGNCTFQGNLPTFTGNFLFTFLWSPSFGVSLLLLDSFVLYGPVRDTDQIQWRTLWVPVGRSTMRREENVFWLDSKSLYTKVDLVLIQDFLPTDRETHMSKRV